MADQDLDRIVADLRRKREQLAEIMDSTARSDFDRKKVLEAVERLRARLTRAETARQPS